MFKPVDSKVNFPEMEEGILHLWREREIFRKSVEEREGGPLFILYEGPPTANASPGIHHVLVRVFKDIIPRYKTMRGFQAPRKGGWDTHGLPVELEVEKELGISSKPEIESYGVDKFNQRCRESVMRYVKDWEGMTDRIAFWIDMDDAYVTFTNEYIESCWWILKQLWDRGLIYRGYKTTPHCPRCGTSLSSHEVALGYRENTPDPSIYIKFKLVPDTAHPSTGSGRAAQVLFAEGVPTFILAWTTTPWTLPGNVSLAVSPEAEYSLVEMEGPGGRERLILASALLFQALDSDYQVVATLQGSELVGLRYEPLYDPVALGFQVMQFRESAQGGSILDVGLANYRHPAGEPLTYPVIAGDFVSMEDGTGVVHIAPAFGEDDFEVGKAEKLFFIQQVDLRGRMQECPAPFSGMFVKDADPVVMEDLRSRGLLYRRGIIEHTYPFCWRCDSPLLYYVKTSWYIRTTAVKERLLAGNQEINWYPEHIKDGRFGNWLENNVDWALSRERYWGTPLPIWECESCGAYECVASKGELLAKSGYEGPQGDFDLHKPFMDIPTFRCRACGGAMRRVPDVIDCWFDSGAMPVAQWHYPFGNEEAFRRWFPADYICEGVDQTRGWFYTLHAISTLLFDQPCYRNVICLGLILDAKGEKMSKTKGNVVNPWEVLNRHGADALRWYLYTASPAGNPRRFSLELVGESLRRFLLTFWNVYSFFVTYANIDQYDPKSDGKSPPLRPAQRDQSARGGSELDRWILSELNQLVHDVTQDLENYDPTIAGRKIQDFVEELSNWYVRRSRRRFWKGGVLSGPKGEDDADKRAAYDTLYQCLVTLAKLLAPFTPFVAEELYQNLVRSVDPSAPESVHLAFWPEADLTLVDSQLAEDTQLAMKLSSLGRSARSKAGIRVRQPLAKVLVKPRYPVEREAVGRIAPQLLDELNVKSVELLEGDSPPLADGFASAEEGGYLVALPTKATPELEAEGLARELVHRLQTMRRSAGFDIADRIITYYRGDEEIRRVMESFGEYVRQETLSVDLVESAPEGDAYSETLRVNGHQVTLGVKRAA